MKWHLGIKWINKSLINYAFVLSDTSLQKLSGNEPLWWLLQFYLLEVMLFLIKIVCPFVLSCIDPTLHLIDWIGRILWELQCFILRWNPLNSIDTASSSSKRKHLETVYLYLGTLLTLLYHIAKKYYRRFHCG